MIATMTGLSALVLLTALATGGKADNIASIIDDNKVAPFIKKASAVIYSSRMTQGTLFQLRGAVGTAWFTRKNENDNWCDVADMRLMSGDFGGDTIGVSKTKPVVLIALNPNIATRLSHGQDIVSEDYNLQNIEQVVANDLDGIDILVAGSAHAKGNYILNPGRNLLNDIFGASSTNKSCEHTTAYDAIMAE